MATIKKIKSGYEAKKNGQWFELFVQHQARRNGWHTIQIPMGAKMIGGFKMIRVQTPCDFFLFKHNQCIALDVKSTKGIRFNASSLTPHQIQALSEIEKHGFPAGYLVNFSELDCIVFYSSSRLKKLTKRSSLLPTDGIHVGDKTYLDFSRILAFSSPLFSGEIHTNEEHNSPKA